MIRSRPTRWRREGGKARQPLRTDVPVAVVCVDNRVHRAGSSGCRRNRHWAAPTLRRARRLPRAIVRRSTARMRINGEHATAAVVIRAHQQLLPSELQVVAGWGPSGPVQRQSRACLAVDQCERGAHDVLRRARWNAPTRSACSRGRKIAPRGPMFAPLRQALVCARSISKPSTSVLSSSRYSAVWCATRQCVFAGRR